MRTSLKLAHITFVELPLTPSSFYDFVYSIFDEMTISPQLRSKLYETVSTIIGDNFDYDEVRETIDFVHSKMMR